MTRDRVTGTAALLGGVAWLVKAAVILATGDQPEYLFELAPILFSIGLVGLYLHLAGRGGTPARIGGIAAALGVLVAAISFVVGVSGSGGADQEFDGLIFGSFLLWMVSLILLGIVYRKHGRDLLKWPSLPFLLGLAIVPLMMVGGALEAVNERLLEIPLLFIAVAWIVIGVDLARGVRATTPTTTTVTG